MMRDNEDSYDYDLVLETAPMDEDYVEDTVDTLDNVSSPHHPDNIEDPTSTVNHLDGDDSHSNNGNNHGDYNGTEDDYNGTEDEYNGSDDEYNDTDDDFNDDSHTRNQHGDNRSQSFDPYKTKAQWSDATVQTEPMSLLGICIDTVARVVVCIACGFVIKPLSLPSHFSTTHPPMTIDPNFCRQLIQTYNLHPDPTRSRPGSIITPVYGLPLFDGFISCDRCGFACLTENRMKTHIRQSQGCKVYRPRHVQTFRPTSNQMYFGVHSQPTTNVVKDVLDPVDYLKDKFAPIPFNRIPIKTPDPCDADHFLNLEHWHNHLEGRAPAEVVEAVRVRDPELRKEVRLVVERYAKDAVKKLQKLDNEAKAAIGDYLG